MISLNIDHRHIMRFLLSGGSATLLHYTIMLFLVWMGVKPVYATGVGALFGAVFNYMMQYHYTFKSTRSHFSAIGVYSMTVAAGLLSNELLFILFYHKVECNLVTAQLLTTALVTVQNYLLYKYLVFKGDKR